MKKWTNILVKVLLGVAFFVMLGFANVAHKKQRVQYFTVEVDQHNNLFFINPEVVRSKILANSDSLHGILLKNVDLQSIEKELLENPFVDKARVFTTVNGNLKAEIEQKKPIARIVYDNGLSRYLDEKGSTFPISRNYSARVLTVSGNIKTVNQFVENDSVSTKNLINDINILSRFIVADDFWKAQIQQVYVNNKLEFELIPRVGGHVIELGSTENLAQKMRKLEIFYRETFGKTQWNSYKTINLKYKDQIVCTKK